MYGPLCAPDVSTPCTCPHFIAQRVTQAQKRPSAHAWHMSACATRVPKHAVRIASLCHIIKAATEAGGKHGNTTPADHVTLVVIRPLLHVLRLQNATFNNVKEVRCMDKVACQRATFKGSDTNVCCQGRSTSWNGGFPACWVSAIIGAVSTEWLSSGLPLRLVMTVLV